ncbi:MAG: hypothetical protein AAGB46_20205 [Verrucomicrobiota bacterium]
MNTRNKSNIIASIILALVPIGPLALLYPAGDVVAGVVVIAALITLGVMEVRQSANRILPDRKRNGGSLYRAAMGSQAMK